MSADTTFSFGLDDSQARKTVSEFSGSLKGVAASLENLLKLQSELGKLDPTGNLKSHLASLQTGVASLTSQFNNLGTSVKGGFKGVGAGAEDAVRTVRQATRDVQAAYEKMSEDVAKYKGRIKLGALENFKAAGASLFKEDLARLKSESTAWATETAKSDARRFGWIAKMQTGSLKIEEQLKASESRESAARFGWLAKMQTGSLKIEEQLRASDARESAARFGWIAKMQTGSLKIEEQMKASDARESAARFAWTAKMQTGSLKIEEQMKAADAREAAARFGWTAKMQTGSLKIEEQMKAADARESAARFGWIARMQTGSLKIAESLDAAAAREDAARFGWKAKMQVGSLKIEEQLKASDARESAARFAWTAKMQTGSLKIEEQMKAADARESAARFGWIAKMQTGSLKIEEQLKGDAQREYSARMAWIAKLQVGTLKMEEAIKVAAAREAAATVAAATRNRDLNARLRELSPAGQLARATRVAAVATDAAGTAYATNRYGSDAVALSRDSAAMAALSVKAAELAAAKRALQEASKNNNGVTAESSRAAKDLRDQKARLAQEAAKLRKEFSELHSASRGLASGFGAMWLTWGSIIPMLAGAAVSNAVMQVGKLGAAVDDTFTRMQVLTGESASSVAALNKQMLNLASSGPVGPLEIAEAMKTLSLAGLNAAEVGASIKDVMNFAIAGDVNIKVAADTLTTVATAFKIGADGFGYISDVIAKVSAETKSSVEDMSGAMKTASVINSQYGMSLEETAVGLALLANVGIKGTAAGTALRNTYADLTGRTKKVAEELKALGVTTLDPLTGKIRKTGDTFRDLLKALSTKSPVDATHSLEKLFGERSGKEAIALFDALTTKAKETGKDVESVYDSLLAKARESAGFSAMAAAGVALTPLNQMKSVVSTLQATLVSVFNSMEPYLLETAVKLKEIFSSEGFKSALQDLITGVGNLITFALEHAKALASVVAGYVMLKSVVAVVAEVRTALLILGASWAAVTAAEVAAAEGAVAVGVATRLATAANPLLLALSAIVGTAAAAWALYEINSGRAETQTTNGFATQQELIKNLQSEADRLREVNDARERGISLKELEAGRSGKSVDDFSEVRAAQRDYDAIRKKLETTDYNQIGTGYRSNDVEKERIALQRLNAVRADAVRLVTVEQFARNEVRWEANRNAAAVQREAEERRKQSILGNPAVPSAADKSSEHARALKGESDNIISEVNKRNASTLSLEKNAADNRLKLLKATVQAGLEIHGQAIAAEVAMTVTTEREKIRTLEDGDQAAREALDKRREDLQASAAGQIRENAGKQGAADKELAINDQLRASLRNLGQAETTRQLAYDHNKAQARNDSETEYKLILAGIATQLAKVREAQDDFNKSEENALNKLKRQDDLKDQLRFASPESRAYLEATSKEFERLTEKVDGYDLAIEKAGKVLDGMTLQSMDLSLTDEQSERLKGMIDAQEALIKGWAAARDGVAASIDPKSNAAARRAVDNLAKDNAEALQKSVADALIVGMTEGGDKGAEQLRSIIEAELRKPVVLVVQAMVSAVMGEFVGSAGTSSATGTGGASGVVGALSAGSTVYNAITGGFAKLGTAVSSQFASLATSSAGQQMGLSSMQMLPDQSIAPVMTESASSMASSAGSLASSAAMIYAGNKLGNALSGGNQVVSGTNLADVGSIAGMYWGPVGSAVGAVVGGALDRIFGKGETNLNEQGVRGTLASTSASKVGTYSITQQDRGWFGGDGVEGDGKNGGFTPSDTITQYMGGVVAITTATTKAYAEAIGLSASAVDGYTKSIDVSTKDLSREAAGQKIAAALSEFGNSMIASAYGSTLAKYARPDELPADVTGLSGDTLKDTIKANEAQMAVTLTRLATDLTTVNSAFETLGIPLLAVSLDGAAAASALALAAGGTEKLAASLSGFYDKFYTDAQKTEKLTASTTDALRKLGLTMPTKGLREWYVEQTKTALALDQTVPANAKLAVGLLSLQDAVQMLTPTLKPLDAAAQTVHSATRKVTTDLMGFADKVADAAKAIASAETTISDGYWTAFDARQAAEQRVIDLTWEAAKATYAYAKTIDDFLSSLDGAKSTQSLQSLKAQLSTTATLASGGDKSSQDALIGQAQKVIDASKTSARTQVEYLRSEAFVRNTLQDVRNTLTKAADASTADLGRASETDPMLLAQRELVKASKDYAEWLVVATAAGVSTEETQRTSTSAAKDALDQWAAAVTAGKKAQEDYDTALSMVKGRHLEFSTSLRSLQEDLDALDVATKAYTDLGGRIDSLRFDGVFDAASASIDGASSVLFDGTAASLAAAAAAVFGDSTVPGTAAHNAALAAEGVFGKDTDAASAAGKIAAAATVLSGNLTGLLTEAQKTEIAAKFTGTAEQAALLSAAMLSAKATLDADSTKVFTDATANVTNSSTKVFTDAIASIKTGGIDLADVLTGVLTPKQAQAINTSFIGTGAQADVLTSLLKGMLTKEQAKTINEALTGTGISADTLTTMLVGKDGLSTSINSLSDLLVDDKGIYGNLRLLSGAAGSAKTAIDGFQKLLSGINFSTQGNPAGLSLPELEVNTVYRAAFGRDAEKAGLDYWTAQNLHGKALFDAITTNAIDGTSVGGVDDLAARKRILGFAVGTNYVPRDMTARIHEGEAIVPKAYNPAAGARQPDNAMFAELVAETRALRAEVAALRKAADSSAKSNQTTATLLRNVMPTGDAIQVTAPDSTATVLVL